jgi:hypothetical protein
MNKRIRELAKQARKLAADEHTNGDEYKLNINDDSYYVQELIQEKFAELIVQECIDIVSKVPNGYRDYRNQIEDAIRTDCLQAIKEHFGVE